MSDQSVVPGSNSGAPSLFVVPDHLKNKVGIIDTGTAPGTRYVLKFAGSRFAVKQGGETVQQIQGNQYPIIIMGGASNYQRRYYEGTYDPSKKAAAPDCWSANGVEPHHTVAEPQNDKCQTCRWAAKNSRIVNGRGTRACRLLKTLAIIPVEPIPGHETAVIQADIASMSIWGSEATMTDPQSKEAVLVGYPYQQFAERIEGNQKRTFEIITMLSFDVNSTVPRPVFRPVALVEKYPELVARVNAAMNNSELEAIINCEPPAQQNQ